MRHLLTPVVLAAALSSGIAGAGSALADNGEPMLYAGSVALVPGELHTVSIGQVPELR